MLSIYRQVSCLSTEHGLESHDQVLKMEPLSGWIQHPDINSPLREHPGLHTAQDNYPV